MGKDDRAMEIIEEQADKTIRRAEIDGIWFFSIIDVVAILTDSSNPRYYWADMKRRITSEGFTQLLAFCQQLKLVSSDGKQYKTDAADTETLLRIIQSIPSPKAEPIKQWLARVGAKVVHKKVAASSPPSVVVATTVEEVKALQPTDDAGALSWAEWHEHMARVYREQAQIDSRLRLVEVTVRSHEQRIDELALQLERIEQAQEMLPDLIERLRPEQLTPEHQSLVRRWVQELHFLTGWHYNMIYQDLVSDFAINDFSDARDQDWERIAGWFRHRLAEARKRR